MVAWQNCSLDMSVRETVAAASNSLIFGNKENIFENTEKNFLSIYQLPLGSNVLGFLGSVQDRWQSTKGWWKWSGNEGIVEKAFSSYKQVFSSHKKSF